MLLKIKEFADFCDVTVKALQLYDRLGVFKPAYVDCSTGYRYYNENQMLELNTLISFKRVGFKLREIADMKKGHYSKEQVIKALQKKEEEHVRQIQSLEYTNDNIRDMLRGLDSNNKVPKATEELLVSKIACLENEKLEYEFSQIMWL